MNLAITIIIGIIMFCLLILVHEFGHFITAKACGVKVNEFSLGMGPQIWSRQKGETKYSFRALPIGGFCAMEGEDEDSDDDRAFNKKSAPRKGLIVCAGAFMNLVTCIVLMIIVCFVIGTASTTIGSFLSNSNFQKAGLRVGDKIVQVDDKKINDWEDVSKALSGVGSSDKVTVTVKRDGKNVSVTSTLMNNSGSYIIGIHPKMVRNPVKCVANGFVSTWNMTKSMYKVIVQLFSGQVSTKELSGPVGIFYMVGESAHQGFIYVVYLTALISLNLAIVNMLPLPALDGGRLLLIIIRRFTGKLISDSTENKINFVGLMLLFALMIYVTFNDVLRFIVPAFK
jgi:Predicted membrane-associated Zn-dependent proteases 1